MPRRLARLAAVCHPARRPFHGPLCRVCFQERRRAHPWDDLPIRLVGGVQRGGPTPPIRCPKCGARPPAWHVSGGYARCWLCGVDAYRTGRAMSVEAAQGLAAAQTKRSRRKGRLAAAST